MTVDPIHGNPAEPGLQMPQMDGAGPAPLPYPGGRDQAAGNPPIYNADIGPMAPADGYVLHGVTNLGTTQDPSAYTFDGNPGPSPLPTPSYGGPVFPVEAHGDADAGGRDTAAATVAASVANATARWQEYERDTYKPGPVVGTVVQNEPIEGARPQQQGSVIGDLVQFPPTYLDPGAGVGNTLPTAAFYDPPREYGAQAGAPGYNQGNEPPAGYQGEAQ